MGKSTGGGWENLWTSTRAGVSGLPSWRWTQSPVTHGGDSRMPLYRTTARIMYTALCDALELHAQTARRLADAFQSGLDARDERTPNPESNNVIYLDTKSRNKIAR